MVGMDPTTMEVDMVNHLNDLEVVDHRMEVVDFPTEMVGSPTAMVGHPTGEVDGQTMEVVDRLINLVEGVDLQISLEVVDRLSNLEVVDRLNNLVEVVDLHTNPEVVDLLTNLEGMVVVGEDLTFQCQTGTGVDRQEVDHLANQAVVVEQLEVDSCLCFQWQLSR